MLSQYKHKRQSDRISTSRKILIIFLLGVYSFTPTHLSAQKSEYALKAAFIERFTRFVEWPEGSAVNDSSKPFILAVIGENPFGSLLNQVNMKRHGKQKRIVIRYYSKIDDVKNCHLLFISSTMKNALPIILSAIDNKPILTISDTPGFAHKGVHINMYRDSQKIRFEINEKAVRKSGLRMSHLLLRMAKIIK